MRLGSIATALLLASALVAPVQADVLHFTNGTFMSVEGHTVEGEMVEVRLKGGAAMSFPKRLVERIETGSQSIFPNRAATNVVESSRSGVSMPAGVVSVTGASAGRGQTGGSAHSSASARRRQLKADDPAALLGASGQQSQSPDVGLPYEHSRATGLRKVSFSGNTALLNRAAQDGTNLQGGKQVLQDPARAKDPLRKAHLVGKRSPQPDPPAESKDD